jgi:hypothetical protein
MQAPSQVVARQPRGPVRAVELKDLDLPQAADVLHRVQLYSRTVLYWSIETMRGILRRSGTREIQIAKADLMGSVYWSSEIECDILAGSTGRMSRFVLPICLGSKRTLSTNSKKFVLPIHVGS